MVLKSKKALKASEGVKKTEFSLSAFRAQSVFIAGDFNQWNLISHPLRMDDKGVWKISLALNPGRYEYRFFVDGGWQNDPNCSSSVDNAFGTSNSVKIVK
jgi:1,4-alpha-glucan branching enzyme